MISKEYRFEAPRDLGQALSLLEKYGDDAKVLAGGMSLVPTMTLGLVQPDVVISLNHIPNRHRHDARLRAATSPPGKSQNSSLSRSAQRSDHCASWRDGTLGITCARRPTPQASPLM